jgi:DNA-binding beta-propeller fold protein YncE
VVGESLDILRSVAVSPDGRQVYASAEGDHALVIFDRDAATGVLTQKAGDEGCIRDDGVPPCADGVALDGAVALAVSPDGRHVYAVSAISDGVTAFTRDVPAYDIDGDGESDPLTDGLLLLRYLFDFSGGTLIANAVDLVNCTRCTAPTIAAYIEALLGP